MKYDNGIIRWSKIATVLFIAVTAVADIFGVVIARYICYIWAEKFDTLSVVLLSIALYLDTVGAYVVLISLFKLLSNMSRDVVFDRANTKLMKIIMGALIAIGVVCGAAGFVWFGSFFLLFAMLFVALIVASVEVVFAKAISMKEEMDLTI